MCSCTDHRGGKITKSAIAVPFFSDWHVRTVKIEGSWNFRCWEKLGMQLGTYAVVEGDRIDNHEFG